eukprot:7052533-Pyramimonas_sp.AAC.1
MKARGSTEVSSMGRIDRGPHFLPEAATKRFTKNPPVVMHFVTLLYCCAWVSGVLRVRTLAVVGRRMTLNP